MYWAIPPEVNAARLMQMGAGPAAHEPQVAAYTAAAAMHAEQSVQQAATAAVTSTGWEGFGGVSMLLGAVPMAAWQATAGAHASAAAGTIQSGMAAYGTAVAATIPQPVVTANRVREQTLIATNVFGINTIPIAETEAEYAWMWGQNASAMMAYLAAVTGLVAALGVPLAPLPDASNPAGAVGSLAGMAGSGIGTGVQALGSGSGAVADAGVSGADMAAGLPAVAGAGLASGAQGLTAGTTAAEPVSSVGPTSAAGSGVAAMAMPAVAGAQSVTGLAPAAVKAATSAESGESGMLTSLVEPLMSAPEEAVSSLVSPLSSVGQLPAMATGMLMSPLSSLAGGMSAGGPVTAAGVAPSLSAASSPWSGMSGVNGGYAAGGSPVTAALTKPSGGAETMGLPASWWAGTGTPETTGAGDTTSTGLQRATGTVPLGMYPGALAGRGARRGGEYGQVSDADKMIVVTSGEVIDT